MATLVSEYTGIVTRERRWFLFMALLLVANAVVGFGYFKYAGISTFASPWWVHVHALTMVGWLGFFVLQNTLVVRGDIAAHRRLGMLGALYACWIVAVGMFVGWYEVVTERNRPFDRPESLALNWMNILAFAVLFLAAFRLRKRSDWHKRLMMCATICLAAPAYGRTLIMFGARTNTTFTLYIMAVIAIAMTGDYAIHRRVHPAWLFGLVAAALMGSLIGTLPLLAPFAAFANGLAPAPR
ncbi:hypothetical protein GRI89_15105 [Altererythrobacter salegens]|uniref:Uncharacterized protein n=1 Tax=Croceibacterium salegens TaxID=1737568 RepID=A0A6I4SZQ0_9SPHN|nr:hypothetical protein [Croceibacterium salegens]MXO60869.1 hypothetical protein [Croceibacterium salegens]